MWPNIEFRIEFPKRNPGLVKSPLQWRTCCYAQKWPPSPIKLQDSLISALQVEIVMEPGGYFGAEGGHI